MAVKLECQLTNTPTNKKYNLLKYHNIFLGSND